MLLYKIKAIPNAITSTLVDIIKCRLYNNYSESSNSTLMYMLMLCTYVNVMYIC